MKRHVVGLSDISPTKTKSSKFASGKLPPTQQVEMVLFIFCCLVKVEIGFRSWVMAAGTGGWWVGNLIISASYRVPPAYQYS